MSKNPRKIVKIENDKTAQDYVYAEKYGGFSDTPIPVSDESKRWLNEFWDVIKKQNMLLNSGKEKRQSASA